MLQYDKVIHDIKQILKIGEVRNVGKGFEALEFAVEVLTRENKVLNNLDIAYSCNNCGQIITSEELNNSTEEYFKDRIQVIIPIESINTNFSEYVCPKCKYKAMGKDFKKLK